jgi:hypothetical protein
MVNAEDARASVSVQLGVIQVGIQPRFGYQARLPSLEFDHSCNSLHVTSAVTADGTGGRWYAVKLRYAWNWLTGHLTWPPLSAEDATLEIGKVFNLISIEMLKEAYIYRAWALNRWMT